MLVFPVGRSHNDPDVADVLRARTGDTHAFGALVRRHTRRAYVIAQTILENHVDADDAVQQAWVRVWDSLDQFDKTLTFAPWLWRIVATTARDVQRQNAQRPVRRIPDDIAERIAGGEALVRALAQLSERRRHIVVFHDVHGIEHGDIASTLDLPVGTVQAELSFARRQLRALLAGGRDDEGGAAHPTAEEGVTLL